MKVAVTEVAEVRSTVQVPVPWHAPDQPAKVEPASGVAVNTIDVPLLKLAEQVDPQLMPEGALATVPVPVPASLTLNCTEEGLRVKFAVTDAAAVRLTVQLPVPWQAPDQPLKVDPEAGVAVSTTAVPLLNVAEQVEPQLIPAGLLVTVPVPVPESFTVS